MFKSPLRRRVTGLVRRSLVQLLRFGLPLAVSEIAYRLRPKRPRTRWHAVSDMRQLQVSAALSVQVYWVVTSVGRGPAASVLLGKEEILRLDCLDGGHAHMHVNIDQMHIQGHGPTVARWYFPPGTAEQHIERAAFELRRNVLAGVLPANSSWRIRRQAPSPEELAVAAEFLQREMLDLLHRHGPAVE